MKAISAALIVVAGSILFSAGLLNPLAESFWTGCVIGALMTMGGLMAWVSALTEKEPPA